MNSKDIIFEILPKFFYTIRLALANKRRKLKSIKKNPALSQNKELKSIAFGKRAFLLATGPSVKSQDLTKLAGKDCFSVSNFFLHKDINVIKPKLHFFAPYHEPLILQNYIDWLNLADKMLPKETNMVLGLCNRYLVEEYNLFPQRKIYFLELQAMDGIYNTDATYPVMAPQTGPIMILPVLDYMGYFEINLIGCDMNVLKDYKAKISNFYDKDPRKNATDGGAWLDIITEMECALRTMKQFKMYDDYFKSNGRIMNNLSPASWLDFLDMKNFDEIVEK